MGTGGRKGWGDEAHFNVGGIPEGRNGYRNQLGPKLSKIDERDER